MDFKFDFDKLYEKVKMHLLGEFNVMDKGLLRYLFIQSHPTYKKLGGMPYIDVLYKSEDKKGNSLTPIVINPKKPRLTVLNDSDFCRADLYYGGVKSGDEQGLDAVFSFTLSKSRLFSKRRVGKEAGEFFREVNKLAVLENEQRYFVYVFDEELKEFYRKLMGGHPSGKFLDVEEGVPKEKVEISSKDFGAWAFSAYGMGGKPFLEKAFSLFGRYSFCALDYKVEKLYSNTLIDGIGEKYYIVVGRVK